MLEEGPLIKQNSILNYFILNLPLFLKTLAEYFSPSLYFTIDVFPSTASPLTFSTSTMLVFFVAIQKTRTFFIISTHFLLLLK